MKILEYYDEFFNQNYLRDLRRFGRKKKVEHAPKHEITIEKHQKHKRHFIKQSINGKLARYNRFYGSHTYYEDMIDYMLANDNARLINHLFLDFDKPFESKSKFKRITKGTDDKNGISDLEKLPIKEYIDGMNEIQEQIQDMILFENILAESWQESKQVYDYFKKQGLNTYCCLSSSKGVHLRVFFKPIVLNNYNDIVHNLHENLQKEFNLKTLDDSVTGKDSNPLKSVERIPYTYNEKSGLRVVPFSFEHDSLNDVIERTMVLSENRINNVADFSLSDYINPTFQDGLLKIDSQLDVLKEKEKQAKEKLNNERIANGTIYGKYVSNTELFKDLRTLVRFVCGDDNLVSEHERYNKYHCVFHDDKNPSAIVGIKNYRCLSSNCHINKLNYFGFIKEWFGLESDDEVKQKMVELQQKYDDLSGVSLSDEDANKIMESMEQEMNV